MTLVQRLRSYVQGLVVGGAVALNQLGNDPEMFVRPGPPFVQLLPDNDERSRSLERVGRLVLTIEVNETVASATRFAVN